MLLEDPRQGHDGSSLLDTGRSASTELLDSVLQSVRGRSIRVTSQRVEQLVARVASRLDQEAIDIKPKPGVAAVQELIHPPAVDVLARRPIEVAVVPLGVEVMPPTVAGTRDDVMEGFQNRVRVIEVQVAEQWRPRLRGTQQIRERRLATTRVVVLAVATRVTEGEVEVPSVLQLRGQSSQRLDKPLATELRSLAKAANAALAIAKQHRRRVQRNLGGIINDRHQQAVQRIRRTSRIEPPHTGVGVEGLLKEPPSRLVGRPPGDLVIQTGVHGDSR